MFTSFFASFSIIVSCYLHVFEKKNQILKARHMLGFRYLKYDAEIKKKFKNKKVFENIFLAASEDFRKLFFPN